MPYPVIILGAGASYDYIAPENRHRTVDETFRPPLTKDLCDPKRYEGIIKQFREVERLVADIQAAVYRGKGLEEYLDEVKVLSEKNGDRYKQLIAFQFYLHKLFQKISDEFGRQSANNYNVLINQINDNGGNACLVTTNYDLLLEQNLYDVIGENISSYIKGPIKLIKLHGSCDWMYSLDVFGGPSIKSSYDYLVNSQFGATRNLFPKRITFYMDQIDGRTVHFCPAIAIPLPGKSDYICPPSHVDELKKALSKTDRILIIGWRANDTHLISLIEEHIGPHVEVTIIAGGQEAAKEVKAKLEHIKSLFFPSNLSNQTFTQFIQSGYYENFFRTQQLATTA